MNTVLDRIMAVTVRTKGDLSLEFVFDNGFGSRSGILYTGSRLRVLNPSYIYFDFGDQRKLLDLRTSRHAEFSMPSKYIAELVVK